MSASEMTSSVALLEAPILPLSIDPEIARQRLDSIFEGHFPLGSNASFVLQGPTSAQLMVKSLVPEYSGIFFLNAIPAPYTKFSNFEDHLTDQRMLSLVVRHKAWLSVDCISTIGSKEDAYRFIGKMLAAYCPSSAIAILLPSKCSVVPFSSTVLEQLGSSDVLSSLGL